MNALIETLKSEIKRLEKRIKELEICIKPFVEEAKYRPKGSGYLMREDWDRILQCQKGK